MVVVAMVGQCQVARRSGRGQRGRLVVALRALLADRGERVVILNLEPRTEAVDEIRTRTQHGGRRV